jgi:hypothetical protein
MVEWPRQVVEDQIELGEVVDPVCLSGREFGLILEVEESLMVRVDRDGPTEKVVSCTFSDFDEGQEFTFMGRVVDFTR